MVFLPTKSLPNCLFFSFILFFFFSFLFRVSFETKRNEKQRKTRTSTILKLDKYFNPGLFEFEIHWTWRISKTVSGAWLGYPAMISLVNTFTGAKEK